MELVGDELHIEVISSGRLTASSDAETITSTASSQSLSSASSAAVGNSTNILDAWRFHVEWDLDGNPTSLYPVALNGAAYVTDFMVFANRFIQLPSEDGTYTYFWEWNNGRGYSFIHTLIYTRSDETGTVTFAINDNPPVVVYSGSPLSFTGAALGFALQYGDIGLMSDEELETSVIGTYVVTENLDGVEGELGRFDLRMLAVKNLSADPAEFNPSSEMTTISGDIVALPASTELFPNGWMPSGNADWRLDIAGISGASIVRTITGTSTVLAPDANGKVGEISQMWDGTDNAAVLVANDTYEVYARSLASTMGGGNTLTREQTTQVTVNSVLLTEVMIDIKPGSDPNSINLGSAGVIPVAIFSSDTFDATTINPETVTLAGAKVKMAGKSGKYLWHEEDVNMDGLMDIVCQVYTNQFEIETGETVAVLTAETHEGMAVFGEDSVRIVQE